MHLGLALIVIGFLVAFFLSWTLGVVLIVVGVLALFLPALR